MNPTIKGSHLSIRGLVCLLLCKGEKSHIVNGFDHQAKSCSISWDLICVKQHLTPNHHNQLTYSNYILIINIIVLFT